MEQVFASFCGKEKDMDGKTFAKLCKDCKLLDKKFTATDVDLIFAKVAPKGQRRITFAQFNAALEHVATKKGTSLEDVSSQVTDAGGPTINATQADAVRFHDDKSTYTGTHVNGGPESVKKGGGSATGFRGGPESLTTSGKDSGMRSSFSSKEGGGLPEARSPAPRSSVGSKEAAASRASVSSKDGAGERVVKIPAEAFESICHQLRTSELLGPPAAKALEEAAGVKGPASSPPSAKATELRTKVADSREKDLETALAKSNAEVEELRKAVAQKDAAIAQMKRDSGKGSPAPAAQPKDEGDAAAAKRPSKGPSEGQRPSVTSAAAPAGSLQDAFSNFTHKKAEMDGKTFAKLCKDCKLLDRKFTATDVDLIFAKVCAKGQRHITFAQFNTALEHVAAKKGTSLEDVSSQIEGAGGPTLSGTQADAVRFHDDKSTYTGTHVNGGPESVKVGGTAQSMFT